ncbi:MAG: type III pantothenate kinase, partial [Puniceicoccales bacterium]|nr:type III pantothenate kinase [Puniceicoccales bacterium]
MKKILCLDIGNTHTHHGVLAGGVTLRGGKIATADIDDAATGVPALIARCGAECEIAGVSFCSVVPAATERLRAVLARTAFPVWHLRHDACPGLGIHYPKPEEIGPDRLANCIGAQTVCGAPAIVIDMGTAVTFDVLTNSGYEGGIIAPGLSIMTRYLHEQTALLPALDPDALLLPTGIGKSTVDAMRLGCVVGFSGMIRELLDTVLAELEKWGV